MELRSNAGPLVPGRWRHLPGNISRLSKEFCSNVLQTIRGMSIPSRQLVVWSPPKAHPLDRNQQLEASKYATKPWSVLKSSSLIVLTEVMEKEQNDWTLVDVYSLKVPSSEHIREGDRMTLHHGHQLPTHDVAAGCALGRRAFDDDAVQKLSMSHAGPLSRPTQGQPWWSKLNVADYIKQRWGSQEEAGDVRAVIDLQQQGVTELDPARLLDFRQQLHPGGMLSSSGAHHHHRVRMRKSQIEHISPEDFVKALQRASRTRTPVTAKKKAVVIVSGKYESRTGAVKVNVAGQSSGGQRFKAAGEGQVGRPFTRFTLSPGVGLMSLRWDGPGQAPSIIANVHTRKQWCLQLLHNFQEWQNQRTELMLSGWSADAEKRFAAHFRLPSAHLDMLCLDWPNGEVLFRQRKGWKVDYSYPAWDGLVHVEARVPGNARVSYSYQTESRVKVTPTVTLPDASARVHVEVPLAWHQCGTSLEPATQLSITAAVAGVRSHWSAEATHYPHHNVGVSVGYKSGIAPVASAAIMLGRTKHTKRGTKGEPVLRVNMKCPLGTPSRATFCVEWNKALMF